MMVEVNWAFTWEYAPQGLRHEAYGVYNKRTKTITIFLDKLLEGLRDALNHPQLEDFLSQSINYILIHELLHHLSPEASETQVEWATDMLMNSLE